MAGDGDEVAVVTELVRASRDIGDEGRRRRKHLRNNNKERRLYHKGSTKQKKQEICLEKSSFEIMKNQLNVLLIIDLILAFLLLFCAKL